MPKKGAKDHTLSCIENRKRDDVDDNNATMVRRWLYADMWRRKRDQWLVPHIIDAHLLFVVGGFGVLEQLFETSSPYKDWRIGDESASSLHIVFANVDGSNQEEKERLTLVLARHE